MKPSKVSLYTRVAVALLAGALVAATAAVAVAAPRSALIQSGYDPPLGLSMTTSHGTVGWEFTPQNDIWVTELGFFDVGQDGLNTSHDVGIWDQDQRLLLSATVSDGTAAQLIGEYRYASVAPLLLQAGRTFVIGATVPAPLAAPVHFSPDCYPSTFGMDPDRIVFDPTIVLSAADRCAPIQLEQPYELTFPDEHYEPKAPVFDPDTGEQIGTLDLDVFFFAPNFRFVPEPTALSLLVVGALLLLRRR